MTFRKGLIASAAALAAAAGSASAQSFTQVFDDINIPLNNGWFQQNNSSPIGSTNYFQGNPAVFPSATGSGGYLGTNFNNTTGTNTISNWFVAPTRTLRNGDVFQFWTRTVTADPYPDRLQIRLSTNGASTNVGALGNSTAIGDFTTLLLDINPNLNQVANPGPPSGNPLIVDGYPDTWRQYTITLSGLPGAGVSGRIAFRYFVTSGGPTGANSDYIGIDDVDYISVIDPTGACCLNETTCSLMTANNCAGYSGLYRGDGVTCGSVNCAGTGACCKEDGTCAVISTFACRAAGGIYRGDSTACGTAACSPFGFTGDDSTVSNEVGDSIATAALVNGYGQQLTRIHGYIALGDAADVYKFQICDRTTFTATTAGLNNALDTELALFDSTGKGLTFDDDIGAATPQSLITGQFVPSNGLYYLAVSEFNNTTPAPNLPLDSSSNTIWISPGPSGNGYPEWAPNGTSVTKILGGWSGTPDVFGDYTVSLTGACFLGCYANCDGSSVAPVLNANDFQCFLNSFSGGGNGFGYANCDNSSSSPVLNANDFQCFLNAFAVGCNS